jgi:hypothetical protein
MRYLFISLLLSSCSIFHDDESITIHKPEAGQTIEIETKSTEK